MIPFNLLVAFLVGWLANSLVVGLIFGVAYITLRPARPDQEPRT